MVRSFSFLSAWSVEVEGEGNRILQRGLLKRTLQKELLKRAL